MKMHLRSFFGVVILLLGAACLPAAELPLCLLALEGTVQDLAVGDVADDDVDGPISVGLKVDDAHLGAVRGQLGDDLAPDKA